MPRADRLPADIRSLSRHHAVQLGDTVWRVQVDELLKNLKLALDRAQQQSSAQGDVVPEHRSAGTAPPAEAWAASHRLAVRASPGLDAAWTIDVAREREYLDDRDPPASLDLRAGRPWYRVADEGTTGSVGWAVADSVLRWMLVDHGRLSPRNRLSSRFVATAAKELEWVGYPSTFVLDDGPSLKAALDVVRRYGAPLSPLAS